MSQTELAGFEPVGDGGSTMPEKNREKLHSFEWLWKMRWVERKSEREIANELGCTHPAVGYWLKKYGIGGRVHPYISDPDILHDLYIRRDMRNIEICDVFNVSNDTIYKQCKKHAIEKPVHHTNAVGLKWASPFIREKYGGEKWTIEDLSAYFGVHNASLLRMMDRYNIERRPQSYYKGKRNKLWQSERPAIYGGDWHKQREEARERDNYECQRCGVREEDLEFQLSVHHKIPYLDFDDPREANRLDNLISLCKSCHSIIERWPVQPHRRQTSDNQ